MTRLYVCVCACVCVCVCVSPQLKGGGQSTKFSLPYHKGTEGVGRLQGHSTEQHFHLLLLPLRRPPVLSKLVFPRRRGAKWGAVPHWAPWSGGGAAPAQLSPPVGGRM